MILLGVPNLLAINIKITGIRLTLDVGNYGWLHGSIPQTRPVELCEPHVMSGHLKAGPLVRRETAQLSNQLDRRGTEESRKGHSLHPFQDERVDLALIGSVGEGWSAREEFVHEDAEGPDVGAMVVALVGDNLGCDILGSSAERPGASLTAELFRETEIYDFDVARGIEKDVFGFEVPVDDFLGVEIIEGLNDTCGVEFGCVVLKSGVISKDGP